MKFGGQSSENVHDVRKECLRKYLCVLISFIKFYMVVLIEIDVGCS